MSRAESVVKFVLFVALMAGLAFVLWKMASAR